MAVLNSFNGFPIPATMSVYSQILATDGVYNESPC